MVIDCPSCRTKFAVEPGLLEGISNPRFHCSRCDHYFDVGSPRDPSEKNPPETGIGGFDAGSDSDTGNFATGEFGHVDSEAGGTDEADSDSYFDAAEAPASLGQLSLPLDYDGEADSLPFPSDLFLDDLEHETAAPLEEGALGMSIPWPSQGSGASLETDMSAFSDRGRNFTSLAGTESRADGISRSSLSAVASLPQAMKSLDRPMFPSGTRLMDFNERPLPGREGWPETNESTEVETISREDDAVNSNSILSGNSKLAERKRFQRTEIVSSEQLRSGQSRSGQLRSGDFVPPKVQVSSGSELLKVLVLPLLFLGIAAGVALYPVRASALVKAVEGRDLQSLLVTPRHVHVDELSSNILSLENGTRVFEIRGRVNNHSEKSFEHILLRAVWLGEDGQELRSELFPAANQLQGSVVESLNGEMLEFLGKKSIDQNTVLAPAANSSFRFILADPPDFASHFAVSVFGAQRVPAQSGH